MSISTKPSPTAKVKDICLWRRKKLSLSVLAASTATWVLLEIYQFNFITLASWIAIFIVCSLFICANLLSLFGKDVPNLWELEISEQRAIEAAKCLRELIEEAIRWVFRISMESNFFEFALVEAGLWVLSKLGSCSDFITLLYIGVLVGLTLPVIYTKYENKMKGFVERVKLEYRMWYDLLDEKVFRRMKKKMFKEKNVE